MNFETGVFCVRAQPLVKQYFNINYRDLEIQDKYEVNKKVLYYCYRCAMVSESVTDSRFLIKLKFFDRLMEPKLFHS